MDKKQFVIRAVEEKKHLILDVSDRIFDYAELGFHEFKTAELYEKVLKALENVPQDVIILTARMQDELPLHLAGLFVLKEGKKMRRV